VSWQRQGGRHTSQVGHARSYEVTRADAGRKLVCAMRASNAGGFFDVPFDARRSAVRIPR
jgi:hypothetical protein